MAGCSLGWRRSGHDWVEEMMLLFDRGSWTDELSRSTEIIDPESVQVGDIADLGRILLSRRFSISKPSGCYSIYSSDPS
jgi:hypothetical protein